MNLKLQKLLQFSKKSDPDGKTNYRPITLLPLFSKEFVKVLHKQIEKVAERIPSPKLLKGCLTQNALLKLLKNWQKCLDKSGVAGAILVDLSEA